MAHLALRERGQASDRVASSEPGPGQNSDLGSGQQRAFLAEEEHEEKADLEWEGHVQYNPMRGEGTEFFLRKS